MVGCSWSAYATHCFCPQSQLCSASCWGSSWLWSDVDLETVGHRNPFSVLAGIYIDIIRGTPLLLQLYFFYFILPEAFPQFELSPFICISIALSANSSAYIAEVIRSGIQAVDRGQEEAARTLGMTKISNDDAHHLPAGDQKHSACALQ